MKNILIVLFIITASYTKASERIQDSTFVNRNIFYFELGGNGLLYSINYEHIIKLTDKLMLSPRIGFSMDHKGSYDLPLLVNIIYPLSKYYFIQIGAGSTVDVTHYYETNKIKSFLLPTLNVSLDLKTKNNFFFKIGFTPIFDNRTNGVLNNLGKFWAGAGIGLFF